MIHKRASLDASPLNQSRGQIDLHQRCLSEFPLHLPPINDFLLAGFSCSTALIYGLTSFNFPE